MRSGRDADDKLEGKKIKKASVKVGKERKREVYCT